MTQEQFVSRKERAERDVFVITNSRARLARALGPQPVEVLCSLGRLDRPAVKLPRFLQPRIRFLASVRVTYPVVRALMLYARPSTVCIVRFPRCVLN